MLLRLIERARISAGRKVKRFSIERHLVIWFAIRGLSLAARLGLNRVNAGGRNKRVINVSVWLHRHVVKDAASIEHELIEFLGYRSLAGESQTIIASSVDEIYQSPNEQNESDRDP